MIEQRQRVRSLDTVRGIAVMGILAMNIIAFALPPVAYMNPAAVGMESPADIASWLVSFIFIDGKMRGFFSFLFGASLAIVADQAAARGNNPLSVIGARQFWLLVIGLIHFYFIWYGDILVHYAVIGMVAYFFRNKPVRTLLIFGVILLALQMFLFAAMTAGFFSMAEKAAAPDATAATIAEWREATRGFATPSADQLARSIATYAGPYGGILHETWTVKGASPLIFIVLFGFETLAYMLLGMAALRSGLLKGEWNAGRYRKWALVGLGIAIPAMSYVAWQLINGGFEPQRIFLYTLTLTVPFRPMMIVAYAAIVIMLTKNGGWLSERIAATGQAAFSNYLGTSIVMTFIFYGWGLGLFGQFNRAELWLPVVAMWALMLLWSKPWLDRYRYGPLEWLWRSLSRGSLQPMRRTALPA